MAKRRKLFVFHGAFKSKRSAVRKERSVGGFVRKIRMKRNGTRYVVMTRKAG